MSLAKGARGCGRKAIIKEHRLLAYLRAFDRYCAGEVPASYVKERGDKMKEVGGNRVSKR